MGFAIAGGLLIGGIASYAGSQSAASAQQNAANTASNTQLQMFNTEEANTAPWRAAGAQALGQLQSEMPQLQSQFTMQDFQQDPGYQFDLNQGEQALQRSAAAKGMLNSAGTQQNLSNYAENQASNEYSNAYNRFTQSQQQRYNMLAGISGTGQVATNQLNNNGTSTAASIGNNQIAAGNAQAAGSVAAGNTISGLAGTGANTWMNYNMMNNLNGMNSSTNTMGSLNGSAGLTMGSGYLTD